MQSLIDRREIETVYYHYAHLLDTQQSHRVALECFTEDATLTYDRSQTDRGRQQIVERFRTYPDKIEATSHNITNILVRIEGDTAHAIARAIGAHWLLDHRHLGPDRPVDFLMIAAMEDLFRRTGEGWRIERRVIHSVSPGSLSLAYGATWGPMNFPHLREANWPA